MKVWCDVHREQWAQLIGEQPDSIAVMMGVLLYRSKFMAELVERLAKENPGGEWALNFEDAVGDNPICCLLEKEGLLTEAWEIFLDEERRKEFMPHRIEEDQSE